MSTCTSFEASAVGVEQDLHEQSCFVARPASSIPARASPEAGEAEAEQLLELIDDKQQRPAPRPPASSSALSKLKLDWRKPYSIRSRRPRRLVRAVVRSETRERSREAVKRRGAGTHVEADPVRSAGIGALLGEESAEAREHQGRLAAAGTADDGDEPPLLDQP